MVGIHELFLNIVIVVSTIFLIRWCKGIRVVRPHHSDFIIGILCAGSIVLSMSFSYEILPGYYFDLRTIPLLVGILYGGFYGGTMSVLSLYLYRFYLGGEGVWNVMIVYSIIMILAFLIVPVYTEMNQTKKVLTSTSMALITASLMMINTNFRAGLPHQEWLSITVYFLLHGFITWIAIYLLEHESSRFATLPTKLWGKSERSTFGMDQMIN